MSDHVPQWRVSGKPHMAAPAAARRQPDPIEVIDWEVSEAGPAEFEPRRVDGHAWRLWLAFAVAVGVVAVAVVSRNLDDGRSATGGAAEVGAAQPTPGSSFRLVSPSAGDLVDGAVVHVRGSATTPGARLQLAVLVGGATLGETVVSATSDTPIVADIPVFAPPLRIAAEIVGAYLPASSASPMSATELGRTTAIRLPITLRPDGPIGFWPSRMDGTGVGTVVVASGCAPIGLRHVTVRLVANDGRLLATTVADVVRGDSRPGAAAGYSLGVGSFEARLAAGESLDGRIVRVEVDWRDEASGSWGTSTLVIPPG